MKRPISQFWKIRCFYLIYKKRLAPILLMKHKSHHSDWLFDILRGRTMGADAVPFTRRWLGTPLSRYMLSKTPVHWNGPPRIEWSIGWCGTRLFSSNQNSPLPHSLSRALEQPRASSWCASPAGGIQDSQLSTREPWKLTLRLAFYLFIFWTVMFSAKCKTET